MIGEFFAGLDVRAELPALGDLVESWHPDVIVRESWEFGSELLAERHGIPILRVGLGLAATEAETIELAAPAVDKARAEFGLPSDRRPRAARRDALHDDDAGGAGGSCRSGAGADPPLSLRGGSRRRGAAGLVARRSRIRSSTSPSARSRPARICPTTRPSTARRSRLWRRSRSGSCSRSATPSGRSRSSASCPSNVHVETWVPHDDVARRADVIVCHGGFGSTLGALAHGAPLVVLPLFSNDQWANGEAVARAGAGITVADDASERKVLDLPGSDDDR